ncbi:MAG TPA: hypothetical protein VES42_10810 [Pilimelia sp.]|nr:hypothetical protein [Pilimelia sp.]
MTTVRLTRVLVRWWPTPCRALAGPTRTPRNALLPSARSLTAVTLGSLLPLCFASEVFVAGEQPRPGWFAAIGDVFPLKHLLQALLTATNPPGQATVAWDHLALVAAWTALGVLPARRAFGPAHS